MAAVEITISGMLYDRLNRTVQNVVLIGEANLTGLGVGGGPIIPPAQPPNWGPGGPPHPAFPISGPPGSIFPPGSGYPPVIGGGPIYPPNIPPSLTPPTPPNPGDPTTPLPPPAGSPGWPVQAIVPPPYIVVQYPGIGPVVVAPPGAAPPTAPGP